MSPDIVPSSIARAVAGLAVERARLDDGITDLERVIRELTAIQRRLARDRLAVPARARAAAAGRTRPEWSPASRRAAAERMRRLWAKRRKAAKPGARKRRR